MSRPFFTAAYNKEYTELTFVGHPKNHQEREIYQQFMMNTVQQKQKFALLFNLQEIGILDWGLIMNYARFMKSIENDTLKYMQKVAIVINSNVVRSILFAMFKLQPPRIRCEIFNDMGDASLFLSQTAR